MKAPVKNMQLWLAVSTNALYLLDLTKPDKYAEVLFDWADSWNESLFQKNKSFQSTTDFILIDEWSDK